MPTHPGRLPTCTVPYGAVHAVILRIWHVHMQACAHRALSSVARESAEVQPMGPSDMAGRSAPHAHPWTHLNGGRSVRFWWVPMTAILGRKARMRSRMACGVRASMRAHSALAR